MIAPHTPQPFEHLSALRLLVVKRDRLAAETLRCSALAASPTAETVVCHTAREARSALAVRHVHLVMAGLNLPDADGLDLIGTIIRQRLASRVLIVSSRRDERSQDFLRKVSVDAFFDSGSEAPAALPDVIRRVLAGARYFSPDCDGDDAEPRCLKVSKILSPAELQVFVVIGGGCDEQETASRLGLSRHTVHTHLQHVMRKMGVRTRLEVMREALRRGFVRFASGGTQYPGSEDALAARRAQHAAPSE